jgi:hypothetical protein
LTNGYFDFDGIAVAQLFSVVKKYTEMKGKPKIKVLYPAGLIALAGMLGCGGETNLSEDNFMNDPTVMERRSTDHQIGDGTVQAQRQADSLRMTQDSLPVLPGKDTIDFID